jgi:predicted nucleic acid-binding protein
VLRRGDPVLERAYLELFERFAPLAMAEPVYLPAMRLRAHFGLRTPDALHLACAQHHRCDACGRMTTGYGLANNMLR